MVFNTIVTSLSFHMSTLAYFLATRGFWDNFITYKLSISFLSILLMIMGSFLLWSTTVIGGLIIALPLWLVISRQWLSFFRFWWCWSKVCPINATLMFRHLPKLFLKLFNENHKRLNLFFQTWNVCLNFLKEILLALWPLNKFHKQSFHLWISKLSITIP